MKIINFFLKSLFFFFRIDFLTLLNVISVSSTDGAFLSKAFVVGSVESHHLDNIIIFSSGVITAIVSVQMICFFLFDTALHFRICSANL